MGSGLLGVEGISGSNSVSPLFDCVLSDELNASDNITCHEVHEFIEETFALVFPVELTGTFGGKPGHLELADHETALIYLIDDLSRGRVGIGLDHSKCALSIALELLASEKITILY